MKVMKNICNVLNLHMKILFEILMKICCFESQFFFYFNPPNGTLCVTAENHEKIRISWNVKFLSDCSINLLFWIRIYSILGPRLELDPLLRPIRQRSRYRWTSFVDLFENAYENTFILRTRKNFMHACKIEAYAQDRLFIWWTYFINDLKHL